VILSLLTSVVSSNHFFTDHRLHLCSLLIFSLDPFRKMAQGRAKARCITSYIGDNPPNDDLILRLDRDQVYAGTEITGNVEYHGTINHTIRVVLEGVEISVVAFSHQMENGPTGLGYLQKHTSQERVILHEERVVEGAVSSKISPLFGFHFALPEDLPGTMRCVLDGTDPTLPSQCRIKYTVTAIISNDDDSGRKEICAVVIVLPKKGDDVPVDASVDVSIASISEALYQKLFDCGFCGIDLLFCTGETSSLDDTANHQKPLHQKHPMSRISDNCIFLETSKKQLNLTAGQKFEVHIRDWFRLLGRRRKGSAWMMKLTEELQWRAKGRTAYNQQTWNIYANHHELPTTLSPSYDGNEQSLVQVRHELTIYMTTVKAAATAKEVLASTAPIPIRIVSSRSGVDA
jgi:hypothetical protein